MIRLGVAALFLAAQFAPALHGFHEEPELAEHCTDGSPETHFCECPVDHDAPPCVICAHAAIGPGVLDATTSAIVLPLPETTPSVDGGFLGTSTLPASAAPRGPPAVL